MLNLCSLHELSEIRRLIDAGSCLIILGGWLDLILMYCGKLLGFSVRVIRLLNSAGSLIIIIIIIIILLFLSFLFYFIIIIFYKNCNNIYLPSKN